MGKNKKFLECAWNLRISVGPSTPPAYWESYCSSFIERNSLSLLPTLLAGTARFYVLKNELVCCFDFFFFKSAVAGHKYSKRPKS